MGCDADLLHESAPRMPCGDRTSAAIGGGYYPRAVHTRAGARIYRVRKLCAAGEFATVTQALAQWGADKAALPGHRAAIVEIADSGTYHEAPQLTLAPGERLVLRAADMTRPVLRMFEYHCGENERIAVRGGSGSRLTIEGVKVVGGPLVLEGECDAAPCQITLRHSTLVPGWDTDAQRPLSWRTKPSLVFDAAGIDLHLDHCIVGPVQCAGRGRALHIADSIVDGGHACALALSDEQHGAAMVGAVIERSTVIGVTQVELLALAENAIFLGPLVVGRRGTGRVRYCYLPGGSLTPQREHCQPDLTRPVAGRWQARPRMQPRYRSLRYGAEGYAKLAPDCAWEIAGGADDGAEMGAWHDLHCAPLLLAREAPAGPHGRCGGALRPAAPGRQSQGRSTAAQRGELHTA